jgi:hypothetical protein
MQNAQEFVGRHDVKMRVDNKKSGGDERISGSPSDSALTSGRCRARRELVRVLAESDTHARGHPKGSKCNQDHGLSEGQADRPGVVSLQSCSGNLGRFEGHQDQPTATGPHGRKPAAQALLVLAAPVRAFDPAPVGR